MLAVRGKASAATERTDGKRFDDVRAECLRYATELLSGLDTAEPTATIAYTA